MRPFSGAVCQYVLGRPGDTADAPALLDVAFSWFDHGSLDRERSLAQSRDAESLLTELTIDGNPAFRAADPNVCSIYVAKGEDVITWSIQTMNPATLPDLCQITDRLARLSQGRVN